MFAAWQVWGTAGLVARGPTLDPRLLWATLALVGALLLGALIIWWVDRWRKRTAEDPETANDQLAHFRELYDRGELSAAEFEQIRGLLGQRLRRELDVPGPADAKEAPPADPDQPAGPPETGLRPGPPA